MFHEISALRAPLDPPVGRDNSFGNFFFHLAAFEKGTKCWSRLFRLYETFGLFSPSTLQNAPPTKVLPQSWVLPHPLAIHSGSKVPLYQTKSYLTTKRRDVIYGWQLHKACTHRACKKFRRSLKQRVNVRVIVWLRMWCEHSCCDSLPSISQIWIIKKEPKTRSVWTGLNISTVKTGGCHLAATYNGNLVHI